MQDVIFQVKADLGPEAVIIEKRKYNKGGIFGFFGKTVFEVLAALEEPKTANPNPESKNAIKEFIDEIQNTEMGAEKKNEQSETDTIEISGSKKSSRDFKKAMEHYRAEEKAKNTRREKQQSNSKKQKVKAKSTVNDFKDIQLQDENQLYNYLLEQGVESRIVNKLIREIKAESSVKGEDFKTKLKEFFRDYFIQNELNNSKTAQKVIALVGPTGVGKTTTMAKLAADFVINENKKAALITADTYRIAAVEQLRTYADILDIAFAVCYSSSKLEKMINERFKDYDIILVDTPGRSWRKEEQLAELKAYTRPELIDEVHLLLSMSTKSRDLKHIINSFSEVSPDKILLTKLDETRSYGDIINIRENYQLPYSYLTFGQDVPEDIKTADAENLFEYLFDDIYG